jgi:hypothetical protein
LRTFLEVFERPEIQNVVILQSIFTKVRLRCERSHAAFFLQYESLFERAHDT